MQIEAARDLNSPLTLVEEPHAKDFILSTLPLKGSCPVLLLAIFLNMLLVGFKVLRSPPGLSVLRNRAIRPFHVSRILSVDLSTQTNTPGPVGQGLAETKATRQLGPKRKEVALASQEGQTGLVSHVLYVL